jgi:uncharacterized membrane protein (UPF0127 family)
MPWLVRGNDVLASLEVADSFRARLVGLLGRDDFDGALLLRRVRAVHTLGMRFSLDVAYCGEAPDRTLTVLRTVTLARHRVDRPVWRSRAVIEARAGTFASWGLKVGDELELKGLDGGSPGSPAEPRPPGPPGTPGTTPGGRS